MGNCLFLHARGWGIDRQMRTKLQIPEGVPGGDMVTGRIEPCIILSVLLGFSNFFPIQKETIYLLCGNDFCNLILFYLFIYFFGKKDPRLLLFRRFCDRNNRLGDLIF